MEEIHKKMAKIAESFYGSINDSEQIPITEESHELLISLSRDTTMYKMNSKGEPISWIFVVPTSKKVMHQFLNKEINERELFNIAVREKSFEALYLCSVFTMPAYRKQGYGLKLFIEAIKKLAPNVDNELYAWSYSEEGRLLLLSLEKKLGRKIHLP